MTGQDFFAALYKGGVDLPIRVFIDGIHPNIYRPHALSFCNLTVETDEEIIPEKFALLEGMDVSIVVDQLDDKTRELTKALMCVNPKHLMVCASDKLLSWAPGRGWK